MSDSEFPLALRDIKRTFVQGDRRLEVLRGVTLDLRPGEIVALVGQSGSGKSTLLHIAGLLERPDEGDVIVDGKSAGEANDRERTALRRRVLGFVYQYHHLLPEFSAIENVMFPQMLNGRSRAQARAPTTGRGACRAVSSSAWRSRGPSPTRRRCCWPTSRPATSIRRRPMRCSASSCRWCGIPAWRRWSPRTIPTLPRAWIAR